MKSIDGPVHLLRDLLQMVHQPAASSGNADYQHAAKEATGLNPELLIQRYRDRLPQPIKSYLRRKGVLIGLRVNGVTIPLREDCSEICFAIAHSMKLAGATPAEALAVTMASTFWKDRIRRGKHENPARFLSKVFDRTYDQVAVTSRELISISPTQWASLPVPVREFLVRELIPMRKVTLIYGDGGTGKTLLAIQLAICVVCGRSFLRHPTKSGRVYAFLAEDDADDIRITLDAVCRHYGVNLGDLGKLRLAPRASFDNIIVHFQHNRPETTPLFEQLLTDIKAHEPILVILDTAADLFGGNENDRSQVRYFVSSCCQRIATETGAAVLLCAHPSAEGLRSGRGTSGSTAWSNSARSRLYLHRDIDESSGEEKDPDFRWLELKKANLARAGQRMGLRWKAGCFAVEIESENNDAARSRIEARAVEEVEAAFATEQPWSAHAQAKRRWFGTWLSENARLNKRAAQKLIDDLLTRRIVVEVEYNSHRHRSGLCTPQQKEKFMRAKQAR